MKIRIDHIKDKPCQLHVEQAPDVFPVLAEMQADGVCMFRGAVTADITVEREFDHLRGSGRVQVPVDLVCGRCLAEYSTKIATSFTAIYRKESTRHQETEDEIELRDDDLISVVYSGDEIDFAQQIEEQVAMEIPMRPLCGEGCKGLCPTCGTDLNTVRCDCPTDTINYKFSALKDYKVSGH